MTNTLSIEIFSKTNLTLRPKKFGQIFFCVFLLEIEAFNQIRENILTCLHYQTLWPALIRFLFICTYNPGRHNEYDHLPYVVAVVTRATQHGESLLLPILQNLNAEYGDEGALTALLVA